MKWEKVFAPSFSLLKIKLEPGEMVKAEPGAMVLMKGDFEVKTGIGGGLLKGIGRKLLGGESLFMNTYIAKEPAEIWFAPPFPGDIGYIELKESEIHIQDTAYLAHHGDINIGVKFRGFKGLFAEGELFWLKAEGTGGVWISAYGGLDVLELKPGEEVILDNFHVVAIEATVDWKVRLMKGGLKTKIFGGEGLVIEARGPGKIFIQSRVLPPFARLLSKYIRK